MTAPAGHQHAAAEAADRLGLPEPRLIRTNMASLWRTGDTALRVASAGDGTTLIRLAQVAVDHGVPASRPLTETVYAAHGLEVTAWAWIDEVDDKGEIPWRSVGSAARRLHGVPLGEVRRVRVRLGTVEQVEWHRIKSRLDALTGRADPGLLALLRAETDRCLTSIGMAITGRENVLLHGDLNPGNILSSRNGPILVDWELARIGPPHWDHVPLLVHLRRFGAGPGAYDEFSAGYGARFDGAPLTDVMCRLREITITLGQVRRAVFGSDRREIQEAERRILYWTVPEEGEKLIWKAR